VFEKGFLQDVRHKNVFQTAYILQRNPVSQLSDNMLPHTRA